MEKQVRIFESLKVGWELFKKRPWYLLGVSLAVSTLFFFTISDSAIATALSYIVYGGWVAVLLRHYGGETIVFDDLFIVDKRWIYFAFLGAIKGLLLLLGFLLLIVPGIYLAIRWMFAEILVIDKGLRPIEALRKSSELTQGVRWKLFGFVVISSILVLLGVVALVVGAVAVAIVTAFAMIQIYKDLDNPTPEASVVAEGQ